jgi:alpha-beta hydrolase superfamily lysophospholipase
MATTLLKFRLYLIGLLTLFVSGCTQVFFYPNSHSYLSPQQLGITHEVVTLTTEDYVRLHNWWLKPQGESKGLLLFLHGNAENISSHIASVAWLVHEGYEVFMLEYRGFGGSEGEPKLPDVLLDIDVGFNWALQQTQQADRPLYVMGQSLGATLAAYYFGQKYSDDVDGLILDAPFTDFRAIAREKLAAWWLSWPLQYPLSWLVPGDYNLASVRHSLGRYPVLLFHSEKDQVVPYHHGSSLCQILEDCQLVPTQARHNATFAEAENRNQLLAFLARPEASDLTD